MHTVFFFVMRFMFCRRGEPDRSKSLILGKPVGRNRLPKNSIAMKSFSLESNCSIWSLGGGHFMLRISRIFPLLR